MPLHFSIPKWWAGRSRADRLRVCQAPGPEGFDAPAAPIEGISPNMVREHDRRGQPGLPPPTWIPVTDVTGRESLQVVGYSICAGCGSRLEALIMPDGTCQAVPVDARRNDAEWERVRAALDRFKAAEQALAHLG